MKKNICFMFTGQGSQYYGMGYKLYKNNKVFRGWMEHFDKLIIDYAGYSVISELYNQARADAEFTSIKYTHPAIYMLEYSLAQTFISMGVCPDYVLGSSLGEAAALAVAGCEEPERIFRFVVSQAELFQKTCNKGGMLTVMEDYHPYQGLTIEDDGAEIISVNSKEHFVLAGYKRGIETLYRKLKKEKKSVFYLPVEFGFHSRCIEPAKDGFLEIADELYGGMSDIPVYSCEKGHAIQSFSSEDLWNIVRNPIYMNDAVHSIRNIDKTIFVDMSPQGTMAALVKMMLKQKENIYSVISRFNTEQGNLEKIQKVINAD